MSLDSHSGCLAFIFINSRTFFPTSTAMSLDSHSGWLAFIFINSRTFFPTSTAMSLDSHSGCLAFIFINSRTFFQRLLLCPLTVTVDAYRLFSHCGKYRSTIDYKFLPNCLQNSIVMSKTFDLDIDNTSDHHPVIAKLDYSMPDVLHGQHCSNSTTKQKIHWSNISQETVNVR